MNCICGNETKELHSYFQKESGFRITVCNDCATKNGFNNKENYTKTNYSRLTEEQQKTPEPHDAYK